ncbi:MAG TPA: TIM barrel protein [Vicinamibacteria bacterium]|nr:TIM barrel protein [Vicinamibacteria bacterium]
MNSPLKRREVVKLGGAAAASLLLARPARAAASWKKIPIGTQLWCVRKQLAGDVPGTLKTLGAMGYEAVELENAFGKTGREWKTHLDAAGLKACGFHHTLAELQGDKLASTIEFNKAIGNRNLIIRSLAEEVYSSADLLKKTADQVNEAAGRSRPHGMRVGYHNHFKDFNRIDGEYWWNGFADQTSKDVILQFDTGNASEMEGVTPQSFIKRNAGRTISMHVKPYSKKDPNAYLGKDELDWPAIMTAAETVGGIEWYIIEYEREGVPPLEALKANLDAFRKLRG